ncbi:MAG: fibronectin type III domain-containing protein [Thermoleophilia bacterium]
MQASSKLLSRTAIILALVLTTLLVVVFSSQQAKALSTSQWETVRGYINSYYGGTQSANAGLDGEAGFRMGKVALWNRLDSNGDIQPNAGAAVGSAGTAVTGVLGEGDDMANRPVLIDNLMGQTAYIPGTEFRCNWNTDQSCFSDSSITAIRQIVDAHKAAGFSTDIVDHCVSSQTAGPSTGGFGVIAQVPGALSSDTSLIPKVYIADYSRNGWRNNLVTASGTGAIAAPETSAGGFTAPGTVANCDAAATDLALMECQANWAISSTGGNVGNGSMDMTAVGNAQQSVDVRTGTISTLSTAGTNLQIPISTLFSTAGLANLDPTKTTVLAGRTQMGSTGAIGLRMLGYTLIPNGSISTGISRWNGTQGEAQVAYGPGLPLQSTAAFTAPGKVDTTGPSVSSVSSLNVTTSSADINRVAGEPATMKVEYGTAPGVYTGSVNNTVLNANKTVGLSGLSSSTTYYYKVTSYDGYANPTVSTEQSFTTATACAPGKPSLSLGAPAPHWGSYADYVAGILSVDWTISNTGATVAHTVTLTSVSNTNGVTVSSGSPASYGDIAGGASGMQTIKYAGFVSGGYTIVGSWHTVNSGGATDCAANAYTYP